MLSLTRKSVDSNNVASTCFDQAGPASGSEDGGARSAVDGEPAPDFLASGFAAMPT